MIIVELSILSQGLSQSVINPEILCTLQSHLGGNKSFKNIFDVVFDNYWLLQVFFPISDADGVQTWSKLLLHLDLQWSWHPPESWRMVLHQEHEDDLQVTIQILILMFIIFAADNLGARCQV